MARRRTLSVILTSRDRYELLWRAVESVFEQTFEDWELIIADDASTDARIHAYYDELEQDKFVTVMRGGVVPEEYRNVHKMNAIRINAAIQVASGRFITYLADDNVWLPRRCERMMEAFESTDADVVVDLAEWITWDGRRFCQDRFKYNYKKPLEEGHAALLEAIKPSNFIVNDCVTHRAPKRCRRCEHWPTDLKHRTPVDWRYWLKLLRGGAQFHKINQVGAMCYFPGTWKNVSVSEALAHRPSMEAIMNKRERRLARKKKGKGAQGKERECIYMGPTPVIQIPQLDGSVRRINKGDVVPESAASNGRGGLIEGFVWRSRKPAKPVEEILEEMPEKPEDIEYETIGDGEPELKPETEPEPEPKERAKENVPRCLDCGGPISRGTKTGRCRNCYQDYLRRLKDDEGELEV